MRVGVYIDGFNLYYGARGLCGRGAPGWRWLDLRSLSASLVARRGDWVANGAAITRLVYCTARISGASNPIGHAEQDVYLKALVAGGVVDHVEYGVYVERVKYAPLARADSKGRPILTRSAWPVMVQDAAGAPVVDARFVVSVAHREEKGSDVNVAAHLLLDVLEAKIDAVIVVSNDSDLELPIRAARGRVPVGLVNPAGAYLAGRLRGKASDGVGGHWWRQLAATDYTNNQLSDPCGGYGKPPLW